MSPRAACGPQIAHPFNVVAAVAMTTRLIRNRHSVVYCEQFITDSIDVD